MSLGPKVQQENCRIRIMDPQKHTNAKHEQEGGKEEAPVQQTPSASSSPSHEFSFTISLHDSNRAKAPPPTSFAVDLSPADDIFFHGHLLPLHLLSHLPVSPRSSTNSMDSFTLPIKELLEDQKPNKTTPTTHGNKNLPTRNGNCDDDVDDDQSSKIKSKPKSFSLFRWRKGFEVKEREDEEKRKKKLRFEVLKKYLRMVRPLLFFKGRRRDNLNLQFQRQPHSFSGSLSSWRNNKQELRGRRGELYSAPASMRTSPTNSGLLVATATINSSSASDSTMEELQAAIQAAIAHCKNSIAAEEKIKC